MGSLGPERPLSSLHDLGGHLGHRMSPPRHIEGVLGTMAEKPDATHADNNKDRWLPPHAQHRSDTLSSTLFSLKVKSQPGFGDHVRTQALPVPHCGHLGQATSHL